MKKDISPLPVIEGELEEEVKESPSPTPRKELIKMDFPSAMKEIIAGKKVTKLEWCNKMAYGVLERDWLLLYKEDGKAYQWILSDADLKGEDYVVID
jgi:hypothetical protein